MEFVNERLADLGLTTLFAVGAAQQALGVGPERAEGFYSNRVDNFADNLAVSFFEQRPRIADRVAELAG